jgi:hypothetical protein
MDKLIHSRYVPQDVPQAVNDWDVIGWGLAGSRGREYQGAHTGGARTEDIPARVVTDEERILGTHIQHFERTANRCGMRFAESHLHAKHRRVDRRKQSMTVKLVAPGSGRAAPGCVGNDSQRVPCGTERLEHGDCVRIKARGREDGLQKRRVQALEAERIALAIREERSEALGERPNRVIGRLLVQDERALEKPFIRLRADPRR